MFVRVSMSGSLSTSALFSRPSSLARISRRTPKAALITNVTKPGRQAQWRNPFLSRRSPKIQTKEPRWLASEQPGLSLNDPRKSKTPEPRSHSHRLCMHLVSTSLPNLTLLDLGLLLNIALLHHLRLLARHFTLLPVVLVLTLSILVRRRSSRSSRGNRLPQVGKHSSRHNLLLLLPVPRSRSLDRRLRRCRRRPRRRSSSGFDGSPGGGGCGSGRLRSGSSSGGGSRSGSLALLGRAAADWCGWVCGCVTGETEGGGVEVAELFVVVLAVSGGG